MIKNNSSSSNIPLTEVFKNTQDLSDKRRVKKNRARFSDNHYQLEVNGESTSNVGSNRPLMQPIDVDIEADQDDYDPFEHRVLTHPTSTTETLIHLLKGSLGSGILAMPLAVLNAGLFTGLFSTIAVGFICTYCVHILVKSSHELSRRKRIPSLGFAETAELAFLCGPESVKKYCRLAKALINTFLVTDLLGCCCVYVVFVAKNLKQVVDHYSESDVDVRLYMLGLLPFFILINMIRDLKNMSPLSMIANIFIAAGVGVCLYYIFTDLPSITERPAFSSVKQLPLFFGTAIFALEGIGVILPLENNMKNPRHFLGWTGVLNIGMSVVVTLYAFIGFMGYWKYGDATEGSITLNLPNDQWLAQTVKLMIAVAIFFTYCLQFYVPMQIIWKQIEMKFTESSRNAIEYAVRFSLVICTVMLAIAIPNLGPFISLIGAVCLSTLGLMFPAIIELITFWEKVELNVEKYNWFLYKNIALISFGMLGFLAGTYVSVKEIAADY